MRRLPVGLAAAPERSRVMCSDEAEKELVLCLSADGLGLGLLTPLRAGSLAAARPQDASLASIRLPL